MRRPIAKHLCSLFCVASTAFRGSSRLHRGNAVDKTCACQHGPRGTGEGNQSRRPERLLRAPRLALEVFEFLSVAGRRAVGGRRSAAVASRSSGVARRGVSRGARGGRGGWCKAWRLVSAARVARLSYFSRQCFFLPEAHTRAAIERHLRLAQAALHVRESPGPNL